MHQLSAAALLTVACCTAVTAQDAPAPRKMSHAHETCDEAGRRILGAAPLRVKANKLAPKKLHDEKVEFPELPAGTTVSGVWVGEILVSADGKVRSVSVLRDFKLDPPFPEFSRAVPEAIAKWRYAPIEVDGRAVPICVAVAVHVDWE